jgi:uncharacterized protein
MPVTVVHSNDPAWVLTVAKAYLASEPVLHNLALTLLHKGSIANCWLAMDDAGAGPIGLVLQSRPEMQATLTPMHPAVITALAEAVAKTDIVLPGVNGEAATVAHFAGEWTERRNTSGVPVHGTRLYELLAPGEPLAVSGSFRQAAASDRDLLVNWMRGFQSETGEGGTDPDGLVDARLQSGLFWLWEDGEPTAMAAYTPPAEGVVRLQWVYTPRAMRKRGYASACVAALSTKLRLEGRRCILYTDLGNAGSNSIYRRLGYRVVAEGLRYRFQ